MSKERLTRAYFSRAEAEAKVGKRIRTRVEFSGVPKGTTGQVILADKAGWAKPAFGQEAEVYDVAIQWDLPRPEPFADLVIVPMPSPIFTSELASRLSIGLRGVNMSSISKRSP